MFGFKNEFLEIAWCEYSMASFIHSTILFLLFYSGIDLGFAFH